MKNVAHKPARNISGRRSAGDYIYAVDFRCVIRVPHDQPAKLPEVRSMVSIIGAKEKKVRSTLNMVYVRAALSPPKHRKAGKGTLWLR